jgi:hypothetical protein
MHLCIILKINQLGAQFFLVYLYLSISTCFRLLWVHQSGNTVQPCLCDTWYLFFRMDDCLVCRVPPCIPVSLLTRLPRTCKIQETLLLWDFVWDCMKMVQNRRNIKCGKVKPGFYCSTLFLCDFALMRLENLHHFLKLHDDLQFNAIWHR